MLDTAANGGENPLYDIIYADPAWNYGGQTQHSGSGGKSTGGADAHYQTMTLDDMKKIYVPAAQDCLLYMWTSSPHLPQAIELAAAWGFSYATVAFVWEKQSTNPGFYTLSQCEMCLVFKKGKIPQPRGTRNERQFLSEKRREHSRKPDEIAARIERMHPTQRKLEMFARTVRPGWHAWGNEVGKFV